MCVTKIYNFLPYNQQFFALQSAIFLLIFLLYKLLIFVLKITDFELYNLQFFRFKELQIFVVQNCAAI